MIAIHLDHSDGEERGWDHQEVCLDLGAPLNGGIRKVLLFVEPSSEC